MTLKDKLAKKLEIIDLYPIQEAENERTEENIIGTQNQFVAETASNMALSCDNSVPSINNTQEIQLAGVVPDFAITLTQAKERIAMLQNFVKEMMILDIDYGIIPKCKKPSLFKSGAEKLCDIFGFSKRIDVVNRLEDWEKGIFHYEVKATLLNKRTGLIEAEGIGSCNSKESKYSSQNAFAIVNTILKMAKKRALIDAVLSATRSSGIFTQDIEDIYIENTDHSSTNSTNLKNRKYTPSINEIDFKQQLKQLYTLVSMKNINIEDMKELMLKNYGVRDSKQLTPNQVSALINYLKEL